MDLAEIKAALKEAEQEAEKAIATYGKKSSTHKAALQIMQFIKDVHYGDSSNTRHLQKIKQVIEDHMEGINNEVNQFKD